MIILLRLSLLFVNNDTAITQCHVIVCTCMLLYRPALVASVWRSNSLLVSVLPVTKPVTSAVDLPTALVFPPLPLLARVDRWQQTFPTCKVETYKSDFPARTFLATVTSSTAAWLSTTMELSAVLQTFF